MAENEKKSGARLPRITEALLSTAWAITPEAMETIRAIAGRENEIDFEALEASAARRAPGAHELSIRDGVGIMHINGPLFRYANMFTMISGATSYQTAMTDLERARTDPTIRSLLISIDSPGGEVNGCSEFAAAIAAVAETKPVESYVGGSACSAAYWIACATSKITMADTASVGSIGVRMGIKDTSERDAKSGVRQIEFISSRAPNKRLDYDTDEGRAKIQRTADQLEAVFIGAVAKYRGVSEETVAETFGAGGTEVGADAVAAGMADAIGSFESVLKRLAAGNGAVITGTRRAPTMTTNSNPAGAAGTFTQADMDAAIARAREEEAARASASASTATAEAEAAATARISAIMDSDEARTRPAQARHLAFKTKMTADEAVDLMKNSAEEKPATTAGAGRAAGAAGGLALDLDVKGEEEDKKPKASAPVIDAASVYNKRAELMRPKS